MWVITVMMHETNNLEMFPFVRRNETMHLHVVS